MPKWFLFGFYHTIKFITRRALGVYFSEIKVRPSDIIIAKKQPTILVSNHPNTLLDPFCVAVRTSAMVHFLANASLFKHPFANWFLNTFYCIPISRPQDIDGSQPLTNEAAFDRATSFLASGSCLYIAPEGTSFIERCLRPLKTGTARIAFDAEQRHDFRLGLQIVPVGLNYSAPHQFRSRLLINVGKPIQVADYQALFKKNSFEAARTLTDILEQKMQDLVLQTAGTAEDAQLKRVETLLESDQPLGVEKTYERSQRVLGALRNLETTKPAAFSFFVKKLNAYHFQLKKNSVSDQNITDFTKNNCWSQFFDILKLIVGFPFFIYGFLPHALPIFLPLLIVRLVRPYIGYVSAFKLLSGLIFFPIFYILLFILSNFFLDNNYLAAIYLLTLPFFGWVAWGYWALAKRLFGNGRAASKLKNSQQTLVEDRIFLTKEIANFLI